MQIVWSERQRIVICIALNWWHSFKQIYRGVISKLIIFLSFLESKMAMTNEERIAFLKQITDGRQHEIGNIVFCT